MIIIMRCFCQNLLVIIVCFCDAHAPGCPHDVIENMIHQTMPPSSIVPWTTSDAHETSVGALSSGQGSAWVLWPASSYAVFFFFLADSLHLYYQFTILFISCCIYIMLENGEDLKHVEVLGFFCQKHRCIVRLINMWLRFEHCTSDNTILQLWILILWFLVSVPIKIDIRITSSSV